MRFRVSLALLLAAAVLLPRIASAQEFDYELGGHAKYQVSRISHDTQDLQAVLGTDRVTEHDVDLRMVTSADYSYFIANLDVEMLGLATDAAVAPQLPGFGEPTGSLALDRSLIDDSRRLFDLTVEVVDEEDFGAVARIDRLSAGYLRDQVVLIAGRQAVSWGGGLAFHVLDLFNPFTPTEIDKDYKTGEDMLYGQYLFSDGQDVQGLAIARRDPITNSVLSRVGSYAAKWRGNFSGVDYDLVAAQHYDEPHLGVGTAAPVFDGVLRFDGMWVDIQDGGQRFSFLVNYDRSWFVAGFNVYGFAEYFHNAFGEDKDAYLSPSVELTERIARGELFTRGKDYVSAGVQVELTPRVSWFGSLISNLHDESGIAQTRAAFDASQNIQLLAGFDVPWGKRGSEFGGLPVGEDTYLALGWDMYLRVTYYF